MDKKSRLEGELQLTEAGRDLLENIALSKHTNPSSIKVDDKKIDIIPIPKGATNGDILKMMFPSDANELNISKLHLMYDGLDYIHEFRKDWWNAPFKKEVEE